MFRMNTRVRLGHDEIANARSLATAEVERYAGRAGTYGRNDLHVGRALVGKLGEIAVETWLTQQGVDVFPMYRWPTFASKSDLLLKPTRDPFRDQRFNKWMTDEEQARVDAAEAERIRREAERAARIARRKAEDRERYGPLVRPANLPAGPPMGSPVRPLSPAEIAELPAWAGDFGTYIPDDFTVEVKTWKLRNWAEYGLSVNADQFTRITTKARAIVWARILDLAEQQATIELMGWSKPADIIDAAAVKWSPGLVGQWQLEPDHVRSIASAAQFALAEPLPEVEDWECRDGLIYRCCFACALPDPDNVPQVRISAGTARFFHHPTKQGVIQAHGNWAFTAPTWTVPVTDVVRSLPACPWCFPRSLETAAG